LVTGPTSGTLVFNGNGSFTNTAAITGTYQFTYQANDSISASNVATVTINVTP
jgi:hypothetical protein